MSETNQPPSEEEFWEPEKLPKKPAPRAKPAKAPAPPVRSPTDVARADPLCKFCKGGECTGACRD